MLELLESVELLEDLSELEDALEALWDELELLVDALLCVELESELGVLLLDELLELLELIFSYRLS